MSDNIYKPIPQDKNPARAPTPTEVIFSPGPLGAILLTIGYIGAAAAGAENTAPGIMVIFAWLFLWGCGRLMSDR